MQVERVRWRWAFPPSLPPPTHWPSAPTTRQQVSSRSSSAVTAALTQHRILSLATESCARRPTVPSSEVVRSPRIKPAARLSALSARRARAVARIRPRSGTGRRLILEVRRRWAQVRMQARQRPLHSVLQRSRVARRLLSSVPIRRAVALVSLSSDLAHQRELPMQPFAAREPSALRRAVSH